MLPPQNQSQCSRPIFYEKSNRLVTRKDIRAQYLKRFSKDQPLPASSRPLCVVIPAYAEYDELFQTLESLCHCQDTEHARVVVVVNHGPHAPKADRDNNNQVWDELQSWQSKDLNGLELSCVDARAKGLFGRDRHIGVGLARRLGLDSALAAYQGPCEAQSLVCLDADSPVTPNYFTALRRWSQSQGQSAAANIAFEHRLPEPGPARQNIIRYELFLRSYVGGLQWQQHPYCHHSIGSCFVVRAKSYVAVRGMPLLKAAEDFYFLNKVRKVGAIDLIGEPRVRPSARVSERVIFGTGKYMRRSEHEDTERVFYDLRTYPLMMRVRAALMRGGLETELAALSADTDFDWCEYLRSRSWPERRKTLKTAIHPRGSRFDDWFDGFETLKMVHSIRDHIYPAQRAEQALPDLAAKLSTSPPKQSTSLDDWLIWARDTIP